MWHIDYGQNNLHQHYDDLNDRLSSIKRSLAVIDSSLEQVVLYLDGETLMMDDDQDLYELPVRIGEVGEDILQGIRDTNHDYGRWENWSEDPTGSPEVTLSECVCVSVDVPRSSEV